MNFNEYLTEQEVITEERIDEDIMQTIQMAAEYIKGDDAAQVALVLFPLMLKLATVPIEDGSSLFGYLGKAIVWTPIKIAEAVGQLLKNNDIKKILKKMVDDDEIKALLDMVKNAPRGKKVSRRKMLVKRLEQDHSTSMTKITNLIKQTEKTDK